MKITLPKDKHIGIIIEPRSGSHAFRNYISSSLKYIDLGEFINPLHRAPILIIDKNKNSVQKVADPKAGMTPDNWQFNETIANNWIDKQLTILNDMANIDRFAIFSIVIKNALSYYPAVLEKIKNNPNIYFIRLKRIDILYSIISIEMCKHTNIWHNIDHQNKFSRELIKHKFDIPLDVIKDHLEMYIKCERLVEEIFDNTPVIHYEQWQNNIRNLHKVLDLPNKLVSVDYQKFTGNYKNLISNIVDIENYYKEFVMEHFEYFQDQHIKDILSDYVNEFH